MNTATKVCRIALRHGMSRTGLRIDSTMTPLALFLPCLGGMTVGLVIDCSAVHPEAMANLCSSANSFIARAELHWRIMPATHGLMLAGAVAAGVFVEWLKLRSHGQPLATVVARTCAHAACLGAMVVGMAIGGQLGPLFSELFGFSAFAGLITAMVSGMAGGMALTTPLYRSLRGPKPRTPQRASERTPVRSSTFQAPLDQ